MTLAHNDGLLVLETRHKFSLLFLLKDFFASDDLRFSLSGVFMEGFFWCITGLCLALNSED